MSYGKKCRRTVRIAGLILGLLIAADFALADELGNPGVVPPDSNEFGNPYGEWSARWWQWLLSIPEATNPNLHPTGANFAQAQTRLVWFLSGPSRRPPSPPTCTPPPPI